MPPVRRRARDDHPAAGPYTTDGWLSRRRRQHHRGVVVANNPPATSNNLPDDALFEIFSRVPCAADVARCAATCRRWGRVVAARAAAISRVLPPPVTFLPHLALGFIYQQRKENGSRDGPRLRFVPTASSAFVLGPPLNAVLDDGAFGERAPRPVASRNGRVVLELRRADGLTLVVWNPMTGDVSVLPTLSAPAGQDYACTIVTGDDLGHTPTTTDLFRLLLIYNHRGSTLLRSYSSDTGRWGAQADKPGDTISSRVLGQLGPAVVLRGVAYWRMRNGALGVRLDSQEPPSSDDVFSLPYKVDDYNLDEHVLAVSPDGTTLRLVEVGFIAAIQVPLITFATSSLKGPDYKSTTGGFYDDTLDEHICLPQIKATRKTKYKLLWFGEKSGTVIFAVVDTAGSSTCDVFAFNIATRSLEKLADRMSCNACKTLCGYEMDRAALLAWLALR